MAPTFMTHVIIPAAGFGKRVGAPKSKELLYYKDDSFPLIQWCLNLCKKYELKPVVVSRKDKMDLNQYLMAQNVEICLIKESEEWTHSVELSQEYWGEKNILVLPDSRFEPEDTLIEIEQKLVHKDLIFGTFNISKPEVWGILGQQNDSYWISEKPQEIQEFDSYSAWGVIGFQFEAGKKLFSNLRRSSKDHLFYKIGNAKIECLNLNFYEDVTRSKENLHLQPKF